MAKISIELGEVEFGLIIDFVNRQEGAKKEQTVRLYSTISDVVSGLIAGMKDVPTIGLSDAEIADIRELLQNAK